MDSILNDVPEYDNIVSVLQFQKIADFLVL